ncbi:MAG: MFS transporter [Phycisphaerales bacterium]|nr:MAG: MFS transporter [Phycisphaerales bacterium]
MRDLQPTSFTVAIEPGTGTDTADRLYTAQFFEIFAAVILFMTGAALQFHFGQYLEYLGHGVDTLGRVLSIAVTGTLLIRFHIGRWVDRFGCRPTWLVGTAAVAVAVGSLQFAERLWLIVILRTIQNMAFAAVMTTVAVFAAQIAPPHRRAESIGTIGLAGFLGLILGPTLGDVIFSGSADSILPYRVFFSASAACSLAAGGIMLRVKLPAHGHAQSAASTSAVRTGDLSTFRIIIQNWPGTVLLVGVCFSMVFCLQMSFLERLAEARGFRDIKVFFLCYAPTAMALRVLLRRMPERFGRSRTVLTGLALLFAGLLCLIGIRSQAQLILPGLLMGAGHSFIFPSMVDIAAGSLPPDYRGTGTALILGAGDLGLLTGFACMGEAIEARGYDVTIAALAGTILVAAAVFAASRWSSVLQGPSRRTTPQTS